MQCKNGRGGNKQCITGLAPYELQNQGLIGLAPYEIQC